MLNWHPIIFKKTDGTTVRYEIHQSRKGMDGQLWAHDHLAGWVEQLLAQGQGTPTHAVEPVNTPNTTSAPAAQPVRVSPNTGPVAAQIADPVTPQSGGTKANIIDKLLRLAILLSGIIILIGVSTGEIADDMMGVCVIAAVVLIAAAVTISNK